MKRKVNIYHLMIIILISTAVIHKMIGVQKCLLFLGDIHDDFIIRYRSNLKCQWNLYKGKEKQATGSLIIINVLCLQRDYFNIIIISSIVVTMLWYDIVT